MTRKRLSIAAATVALGLGTLGFGSSPALAAGKGVGRSVGTTGKARACEAHAANNGKSVAKGLNCTPTQPPPPPTQATFSVIVTAGQQGYCDMTFSSSGLAPEANITYTASGGGPYWLAIVPADGAFNQTVAYWPNNGMVYTFTAPTAGGGAVVSVTATSTC